MLSLWRRREAAPGKKPSPSASILVGTNFSWLTRDGHPIGVAGEPLSALPNLGPCRTLQAGIAGPLGCSEQPRVLYQGLRVFFRNDKETSFEIDADVTPGSRR
jgi:hypothetical protein